MRDAFSLIELIFVIVIIGILAAVAIPKLSATRDDAYISQVSHTIASSATEIAAYAVSQGTIEDDLSKMSNGVDSMVQKGEADLDIGTKSVWFHMGNETQCIQLVVDDGVSDANLSVTVNQLTADSLCDALVNMFDTSEYPIPLRGQRVVH